MYRKPEGGEERTGLCESTPVAVFQQRSWDFREGHVRLFSYEATERCGRGACSDKVSEKSKEQSVIQHLYFFFNTTTRRQQKKVLGVSTTPKRTWFFIQFIVKTTNFLGKQCHRNQNTEVPEEGEQVQGIQIPNNIETIGISKLNCSWASDNFHDHIHAPGLKQPWIQTSAVRLYYLPAHQVSVLPWTGHTSGLVPPNSSRVLSTTHSTAYPRDSPKALQASYAIIPSTTWFVCYEQSHRKQSDWREQNWKGADTIKAALRVQRQISQKFSV